MKWCVTVPRSAGSRREDLSRVPGIVAERRQVLDVPEIHLLAQEHQLEAICCPNCHTRSLGSFPASVSAPVQYGPNLQALAVYLHQGQLLPTARTCEALAAICGCQISEATLLQWSELAAERLAPTVERIAELIVASHLQHGDETGIRVYGMLHWLHVNCTRFLTHLAWHRGARHFFARRYTKEEGSAKIGPSNKGETDGRRSRPQVAGIE